MDGSEEEPDKKLRDNAKELRDVLELALRLSSKNVAWADDARAVISKTY